VVQEERSRDAPVYTRDFCQLRMARARSRLLRMWLKRHRNRSIGFRLQAHGKLDSERGNFERWMVVIGETKESKRHAEISYFRATTFSQRFQRSTSSKANLPM
jgi:hypothetical protein